MIYHDVSQQSEEWYRARLGVATASCFDKIVTPKTGEFSKSAEAYAATLIGEIVTGQNEEKFQSYWMERGAMMELDARSQYQAITELELDRGGFLTNDAMTWGASPDVRVLHGSRVIGGAEIKCPMPSVHIANLKRMQNHGVIDPSYIPQVQGQIFIGEFDFVDWFSYHPNFPPAHIRTYRDDAFIAKLETALKYFDALVDDIVAMLTKMGTIIPPRPIVAMYNERFKETQSNYMGG
jgi:hypothetical protein